MVHLVGVVPSAEMKFLTGNVPVGLKPTKSLLSILKRFPEAKIGIERLSPADWMVINEHLFRGRRERNIKSDASYPAVDEMYWKALTAALPNAFVSLDAKDHWLRHNGLLLDHLDLLDIKRFADELSGTAAQEDKKVYRRLLSELYKANLLLRESAEIRRGRVMLDNIKKHNVDVAIVPQGYADEWCSVQRRDVTRRGIVFDDYVRESRSGGLGGERIVAKVERNPIIEERDFLSCQQLKRALHLLRRGTLTRAEPQYTGTWDVGNPLHGYFEIHIARQEGSKTLGTILDMYGEANFGGEFLPDSISFTKQYTNAVSPAGNRPIFYILKRKKDDFVGEYLIGMFDRGNVVMTEGREDVVDLCDRIL